MARMARLLRAVPELLILIKGMMAGMRAVFFVCILMLIFTYIMAIALVQISTGTESVEEEYFETVPAAMLSLLIHGALLDEFGGLVYTLQEESIPCMVAFIFYIVF